MVWGIGKVEDAVITFTLLEVYYVAVWHIIFPSCTCTTSIFLRWWGGGGVSYEVNNQTQCSFNFIRPPVSVSICAIALVSMHGDAKLASWLMIHSLWIAGKANGISGSEPPTHSPTGFNNSIKKRHTFMQIMLPRLMNYKSIFMQ